MQIETKFGQITVNGTTYMHDIVIDVNGNARRRSGIAKNIYGTDHQVCTEEIKDLLQGKPEAIIIGTGQYGSCQRFEAGVQRECQRNNVRLIVEKTPSAIKTFEAMPGKKAALFHVSC